MMIFGGSREEVLSYFCNRDNMTQIAPDLWRSEPFVSEEA